MHIIQGCNLLKITELISAELRFEPGHLTQKPSYLTCRIYCFPSKSSNSWG